MKVTTQWIGNVGFAGHSEKGHRLLMDGPAEEGGKNLGPRPMEMLLLGMGGCSSYDVVTILKKSRQSITGCKVAITAQRQSTPPKVFTCIHLHFTITGIKLSLTAVKRAIKLSTEKYCSASIMLGKTAKVSHTFAIVDENS